MKRVKAVIVKEFAHIVRDPTSLVIIFLMPLLMMFIYGYAMNFDLERVDAGVIDYSQGELSQKLIEKFANNRYFVLQHLTPNLRSKNGEPLSSRSTTDDRAAGSTRRAARPHENPLAVGERMLRKGSLKELIVIPADFAEKLHRGQEATIGIIIDGSDANIANLVYQYNERIILEFIQEYRNIKELLKLSTKIYFNSEMKSAFFFVPGLIAVLLVMISALLTSLSISREKESGSIDLVFISPLKTPEIIIGKTVPYIAVALIVGAIILAYARFWFGVPIRGSLLVLLVFSILYVISGLSLGILISTAAPSQKVAMFAALLGTLLPSIMLSGFIFPLDSLGTLLQAISYLVPATYFLKIIRGVVLKGAEIKHFIFEGAAMAAFSAVLLTLAMIKFNRSRKRSR